MSPSLAVLLLGNPMLLGMPFFLAGGVKIVYDLLLYRSFVAHRPPEEAHRRSAMSDRKKEDKEDKEM